MGLNLNIKRIIFSTLYKNKGRDSKEKLTDQEIKQIAGRAGRRFENGFVTAFKSKDLYHIRKVLKGTLKKGSSHNHSKYQNSGIPPPITYTESELFQNSFNQLESQITQACLFPPVQTICDFNNALNKYYKKSSTGLVQTLTK